MGNHWANCFKTHNNSQCTHWVSDPSPPVTSVLNVSSLQGHDMFFVSTPVASGSVPPQCHDVLFTLNLVVLGSIRLPTKPRHVSHIHHRCFETHKVTMYSPHPSSPLWDPADYPQSHNDITHTHSCCFETHKVTMYSPHPSSLLRDPTDYPQSHDPKSQCVPHICSCCFQPAIC